MRDNIIEKPFRLTFLDEPYVSDFFLQTIEELKIAVVQTPKSLDLGRGRSLVYTSELQVVSQMEIPNGQLLYTHSENSIGWIEKNIGETDYYATIQYFKNKVLFRDLLRELYPDFFYTTAKLSELGSVDVAKIRKPFVIKPSVGFLSLGVIGINNDLDWEKAMPQIISDSERVKKYFPASVVDSSTLIIEEYIKGEEYASDCYFDAEGRPVVLSIFKHVFASGDDVSDRVYTTSVEIVKDTLPAIESFLIKLGKKTGLKNFPLHLEVRIADDHSIMPIEVNPARFGGWCTTADMAPYSYGFNPYEYYFNQIKPEWSEILANKDSDLYSIIVLDNRTGIDGADIKSFDYKKLAGEFENPLEIREVDFSKHPLFGFMYLKTRKDNFMEIERILRSDLMDYVRV